MPTALIADDEPHLARHLQEALARHWPSLQVVHVARQGLEASERIAALQPDVAFLDIQMPGLTGLEVAEGIEGRTRVVFVTAFDEFAVQAFELEAVDYVLKPIAEDRLLRTLKRLQRAMAGGADTSDGAAVDAALGGVLRRLQPPAGPRTAPLRWIRAGSGDLVHQVAVDDVLYFHADEKYTGVHTATSEHLIRTTIAELAASLDPEQFWQVHRSTIVNLRHLAGTRRDDASRLWLRLRDHGRELPVSRAYAHRFKAM